MDSRQAAAATLDLLAARLPNADVDTLASALDDIRHQTQRRRREARRLFADVFLRHVAPERRDNTRSALMWLFGDIWLPPAPEDVERAIRVARHSEAVSLHL